MKTNTRNKIFKKSCLLIVILALILIAIGNGNSAYAATSKKHVHSYSPATCTSPKTCSCGARTGSSLGHDYAPATCTSPAKCKRCGLTKGSALGHDYTAPTCRQDGYCKRCGAKGASKLGHLMSKATCMSPSKCTRSGCSYYEGQPLGHKIVDATCTQCKHCDRCNTSFGTTTLTHNSSKLVSSTASTCKTQGQKVYACSMCGKITKTELLPLDSNAHNYVTSADGTKKTCTRCNKTIVNQDYSIIKDTALGIIDDKTGGINSKTSIAKDAANLYGSVKNGNNGDTIQNIANLAADFCPPGANEVVKETGTIAADAYNKEKAYVDNLNDFLSWADQESKK